jgi:hypothetical protein
MTASFLKSLPVVVWMLCLSVFARGQTIQGPSVTCKGQSSGYAVTPVSPGLTYQWIVTAPGNIIGPAAGSAVNVMWSGSGAATLSVAVYNGTTQVGSATYPIQAQPVPQPALTSDSRVACQQLSDPKLPPGPIKSDKPVQHEPGILNDADGCIKVCENSTVTYTANGNAGSSYSWAVTGAASYSPSGATCTVVWGAAGSGSITVTETTVGGCVGSKTTCFDIVEAPKAMFSAQGFTDKEIKVCLEDNIVFVDASTGSAGSPIMSWYWDFGDGSTFSASNGSPVQHAYHDPGDYKVILTVKNACGCSSSYVMIVHVSDETGVNIVCPSVVCEGASGTYHLEPAPKCDKYQWSADGGTILNNSNAPAVTVVWDNVGPSGFGYLSFDAQYCDVKCGGKTTVKIPVIQAKGTIAGPAVACQYSQTLYAMPEWPTTTFTWSLAPGANAFLSATDQGNQIVLNAASPETVTLRCTYYNTLLGCGGSAQMQIQVQPAVSISGSLLACLNAPYVYSLPAGYTGNWTLNGPGGSQSWSGVASVSPVFSVAGTYTLAVSGGNFCAPDPLRIKVNAKPSAPTTLTGSEIVCAGVPTLYKAGLPQPGSIFSWAVVNGSVSPQSGPQTYASFTTAATSVVKVWRVTTDAAHCASDTLSKVVSRPVVNAFISGSDPVCPGMTYTYNSNYSAGETYKWSVSPASAGSVQGNANGMDGNIMFNTPAAGGGTATIQLEITRCGVKSTFTKTVMIRSTPVPVLSFNKTSVCRDELLIATVTNPGIGVSGTSFSWSWGDNSPNGSGNPGSHVYTQVSQNVLSYPVEVTVTAPYGCVGMVARNSQTITVNPSPVVSVSTPDPTALCPGSPFPNLTASLQAGYGSTTGLDWHKTSNPGPVIPVPGCTGLCYNYQPTSFDGYYVIASNSYGCTSQSNILDVTQLNCSGPGASCGIIPQPGVTLSGQSLCGSISVTANINAGGGTQNGYNWSVPQGGASNVVSTATSYSAQFSTPGYKLVRYVTTFISGSIACTKIAETTVLVKVIPAMSYSIKCNASGNGYDVTFFDRTAYFPGYQPLNYLFHVGNGNYSSTTGQVTVTLPAAASYPLSIDVNYNNGGGVPCTANGGTLTLPALPVAKFDWSPKPAACKDQLAVPFSNSSTGLNLSYNWTFPASPVPGQTVSNSAQLPYYTFPATLGSTSFVRLQVRDLYGCVATADSTIGLIGPNLSGTLQASATSACYGSAIQLNYVNSGTGVPNQYTWYNDNTPLFSTTIPVVSIYEPGAYWVKGSNTATKCYVETPKPPLKLDFIVPPVAVISGDSLICLGNMNTLNGYAGPGVSYQWYSNGSPIAGATGDSYTYFPTGTGSTSYTLVTRVTSGSTTCSATSAPFVVTVVAPPAPPSVSFSVTDCSTYTVELTAYSPAPGASYTWSSGAVGNPVTVHTGGPYRVFVTDNAGCSAHADLYVPKDPKAYLWTFPSGCYAFCRDELPKTLVGPTEPFNYWAWLLNGNPDQSGSGNVQPYTVTQPGSYNLTLANAYCQATSAPADIDFARCADCKEVAFRVEGWRVLPCDPKFKDGCCYYMLNLLLNNVTGTDIAVNITTNSGSVTPGGVLVPAGSSGSYNVGFYPAPGFIGGPVTITVTYTTYDDEGNPIRHRCSQEIKVEGCKGPAYRMASASQSNKSGTAGRNAEILPAGNGSLVLIPNPASTTARIDYQLTSGVNGMIEVYDLTGRKLADHSVNAASGSWTLDLKSWSSGTYVVILREEGKASMQTKLSVVH